MFFYDDLKNINLEKYNVFGIDETGVGDYFTPIIGCVAYLPNHLHQWAIDLGVKDSKKLSNFKINSIAVELINKIEFTTYKLSQKGFNSLTKKGFNSNEIKYFIHFNSISRFSTKYLKNNSSQNIFIIDRYSTFNSILRYKEKFNFIEEFNKVYELNNEVYLVTKAESIHLSVACASIIARYFLNLHMKEQNKKWNFKFPLGANSKVKDEVKKFQNNFGMEALDEVCKTSFKL